MKYLLDTNVYLGAFRSDQKKAQFRQTFFPLLPATFLSSVVAYELYVNAQDNRTRSLVQEFIRPMEQARRLVAPAFDDWVEASAVVTAIEQKDKGWRSKLPALLNDILISLCARRIGATVVTYNKDDFQLIRRHKDFSLRVLVV
ncbi:MAG: type II toxin-antitoxin system VapC family toxin [Deltaproteobacteria bacterium]|nr:type II toxin-antitoxin system VapC family toxin [Deltaproteobacteria bacterium]MBI2348545.1 type II toxin-antitoxin system VapC family toxin [Deltaproteobacteria bacterium]MBI2539368.1 type II toxin-antitoxin system VapC family toxin [Deltaproteobacteria bacterium]